MQKKPDCKVFMKLEINDINSNKLDDFREIKLKRPHLNNLFIIESFKVYKKALESNIKILKTLTTKEIFEENKKLFSQGEVFVTNGKVINDLIKFKSHTKVFSIAEIPDEKIDFSKDIIFFNNITSPENVGAITRSALAFNFNQIAYDASSLTPWNRRPVRVSTGNIFKFNTKRILNNIDFLKNCKNEGYEIVSMANSPEAIDILQSKISGKKIIILGSEGHGIEDQIIKISTKIVKIPINEYVGHLNVGHAAAITFFQYSH